MLSTKLETVLAVAEHKNFTRAAEELNMTQPAVSHHIKQLEQEVGAPLFVRNKAGLKLTAQGEIESNLTAAALARYSNQKGKLKIILFTDTINNLYDMLENYELDLAIVDGAYSDPRFSSMLLDTDYLTCVMSVDNPLARKCAVTLAELKRQKMILRTPASATRMLFESALESNGESIQSFDVTLEVDNIATIKDLIRKDLGVSILPRSACLDELRKGKIAALPVENLSMVRETRIVYNRDFTHTDMLNEIIKTYGSTVMN